MRIVGGVGGILTDSILCNSDISINNFNQGTAAMTSYVAWQTGFWGDHYLPTPSPYQGAGSTTPDRAGLYGFTTQTNQAPQGASAVDLGYHYRATDSNGNPLDDNGDAAICGVSVDQWPKNGESRLEKPKIRAPAFVKAAVDRAPTLQQLSGGTTDSLNSEVRIHVKHPGMPIKSKSL